MTPRVSVVIPACDGEAFIAEALTSVRAVGDGVEIVVVDDGSTDRTAAIVRAAGSEVRYLRQERRGPAAARNRGVAAAGARLLAFLDQDDLWPPSHLAVLEEALASSHAAVAHGRTQALVLEHLGPEGPVFEPRGEPWWAPHVGSALFTRAAFEEVGPFDERLRDCSDDLDWFMRARERRLPMALVDDTTYCFRIHERNTSRDAALRRRALLEAVRASVHRRREARD